ncbi:MAG: glycoside hydrolase family 3 C-terminal domain-containing protein [Myxococcales bacterium]|nr:glycoside hydrolase family 3 C-terminal domain-containing protein [Myxococcales bacterium]
MEAKKDTPTPFSKETLEAWLAKLSLKEKIALCSGASFWTTHAVPSLDLPSIVLSDGPHGVRKQPTQGGGGDHLGLMESVPATCYPTAAALASSWDVDLLEEVGDALGEESRKEGVAVLLGPGANIKRHPCCGRNFEYFSEDPYLSGHLAAAWVRGLQRQGVGASLKHFAVNNHEFHRLVTNAVVDERTLREIYLTGFEIAVKEAQPWTVMAAYNRVNGSYCCEHPILLEQILRKEWGFQGLVVSDWGAVNDRVAGIRTGMDLEMPGNRGVNDASIHHAIQSGKLSMEELDRVVSRILHLLAQAKQTAEQPTPTTLIDYHTLARKAAAASFVLLKNEGQVLPLQVQEKVVFIGEMAKHPRYQGNGSSRVRATQIDNALDEYARWSGETVPYAQGYESRKEETSPTLLSEALALAKDAEKVVLFVGLPSRYETEGMDREHLRIPPNQAELLEQIAKVAKHLIVVLSNGAPVEMPWIEKSDAIVESYLGGQAWGGAIVDILTGQANPSGKLAETFPLHRKDLLADTNFPGEARRVLYQEGLYVGYRDYNTFNKDVLFPFGYGLSYTTFSYDDIEISATSCQANTLSQHPLQVRCRITNTGTREGAEVVQLYIRPSKSPVPRPEHELKGFAKVSLQAGESKQVEFLLDQRAFAYYDIPRKDWHIESGLFTIQVGASSRDIRLQAQVYVQGQEAQKAELSDEIMASMLEDPKGYFAQLLNDIPQPLETAYPFHLNSTLGETRRTRLGRLVFWIVRRESSRAIAGEDHKEFREAVHQSLSELPLRSLVLMSQGYFRYPQLESLVHILNGHWGKGINRMIQRYLLRKP